MKFLPPTLLALALLGCQSAPPPAATTPTPTAVVAPADQGWFTYFAPDGKYSLQFPKAPETKAATPVILMLVYPLDKMGSSLGFISSKIENKEFTLKQLVEKTRGQFGKDIKVIKSEEASWGEHKGIKVEMEMKGNRAWIHLIVAKPYLYQLLAVQSKASTQDFPQERDQYFSSFQFTKQ
ncbi:MAG: hypothetical protein KF760_06430 [Candidatus Eremiobacteraeota bacterium]|nr:hypothetical protein [Candidatus Eremiobacteraeota bacterium]MCW5866106.1 hypothetical protein [Candidatus Eremiobacteraeota bacterium]